MQTSPYPLSVSDDPALPARRTEYVVYQVVTLCAILLVLGTVWAF